MRECHQLVEKLNEFIPQGKAKLIIPDVKFNRSIGNDAGKLYGVDGRLLSEEEHRKHLAEVLPTAQDERILNEIFKQKDWVLQMN